MCSTFHKHTAGTDGGVEYSGLSTEKKYRVQEGDNGTHEAESYCRGAICDVRDQFT